ncbi:MAG TPA: hypothetical protein V6C89_06705 [Drouetiella sp.]
MSEIPTSVKELIWLATYYDRNDMPENAQLIRQALERTSHSTDEWAPVRHIEEALANLEDQRKSA